MEPKKTKTDELTTTITQHEDRSKTMGREIKVVELSTPITVYGQEVKTITLRKPTAGELRGVKLWELLQMDISAVRQVVLRIATPHMSPEDFDKLEPIDLLKVTSECVGFFMEESLPM